MSFIYEINGQRVEFENEPTEADIDEAAKSLGSSSKKEAGNEAELSAGGRALGNAALGKLSPISPYATSAGEIGQALKSGAQNVAKSIGSANLGTLASGAADVYAATHGLPPLATVGKKVIQSVLPGSSTTIGQGLNAVGQGIKGMGSNLGRAGQFIAEGAIAPENLFSLPYQAAAYEQEKIRENPNAPEYATNPYAQQYRGEAPTQGAAGAQNRRDAIAGQQYGNLTTEERAILQQDAINRKIRLAAAQQALRPIAPTPIQ